MSRRTFGAHAVLILVALMVLSYQNCGQFTVDPKDLAQGSIGASASAGSVLEPATDKIDTTCPTNPAYDACVIKQNPTAQLGTALSTVAATRQTQLAAAAIYGVKLTSLASQGTLSNATLSIQSASAVQTLSALTAVNLKSPPTSSSTAGNSYFEQVNTYYWMNRAAEYLDARTGGRLPAKGKGIKVIVDDTLTGYNPTTNTIHMKKTESAGALAWNGDLAVQLFGVANVYLANPSGWKTLAAATHQTCNATDNGCCRTAAGCGASLRFAGGEYFAACLFPLKTSIGAGYTATGSAQSLPGIQRDISSATSLTAATIFTNSLGDARSMGLLYASIWWELRSQAGTESSEVDRLFLEHLNLLTGADTFSTALEKAKTVDQRLFSGRYSARLAAESGKRGL